MRALILVLVALLPLAGAAAGRPHVYLIVIDGLGADAVDPRLMPRLTDPALCDGPIGEARAGMPTRTNPNHVTLLTGALAESHGVTGNWYWDRRAGKPHPLDDPALVEMETLFTTAAASRPPRVTVAAFSKERLGRLFAAVPPRQHGPDVLWAPDSSASAGHVGIANDGETIDGLIAATVKREPDLAVVNLSEVDRTAHARGTAATADARGHADAAVGKLVDDLKVTGRWDRSLLIVTSDHGFDDVAPTAERPAPIVELGTRFAAAGIEGVHVVSDGGVAHVYADETPDRARRLAWAAAVAWREPGVADVLARIPVPGVRTLHAAHPDWGLEHERAGDLLVVARTGYELVDPIDEIGQTFLGNHGSPREMRVPLVITGGALKQPACRFTTPPTHADLGTTIGAILGLRPTRRFDGRPVRRGKAFALPLR
jgi:hypothetical protein